jgi:hypothetical protein
VPDRTSASHPLRRLGANVYWGPLVTPRTAQLFVAAAEASTSLYELDRDGNPPSEDFCISASPVLADIYGSIRPVLERVMRAVAYEKSLRFQTPYLVRYLPQVRADIGVHADRSFWSCVIYLNRTFKGGELEFPTLGLTIRPEPGFAAIFPGGDLYPHRSKPVTEGCKYALVLMTDPA